MLVLKRHHFEQRTLYTLGTCDLEMDFELSFPAMKYFNYAKHFLFPSGEKQSQFVAVTIYYIKPNRFNIGELVDWMGSNLSSLGCQVLFSL